ncbi:MAG: sodium/proline symporter PutP [Acidobacteriota bacterium]
MSGASIGTFISFGIYLFFMLAIGWHFYNRTKNLSDYVLGGRGLNAWVTSLSAQASDMSGWLLLGLPGYAYLAGLEAGWIALGLLIGTYLNWKFIAGRLRRYTRIAGDSITLPVYFENRFRDKGGILRVVSALFILIFFLLYTSSGFVAGAKLFNTVFNIPYIWALAAGVFVIIGYTFLGGFMAVSWTDFFQGSLMFFSIIIIPLIAMSSLGGYEVTVNILNNIDPKLMDVFTGLNGERLSVMAIVSMLAWGLGYFGQPHILARFMAISSPGEIPKARKIAMGWVFFSLIAAVAVGLVGRALLLKTPLVGKAASETVFMVLVNQLTNPFVGGILLAAILAAVMSTADSQLLVTSSAITEDLYKVIYKKKISEKKLVWIGRFAVIGVALVAFFIALDPDSSVLELVAYAWAGFGATFGPVIILSLFWKRMTATGAIAGIFTGGLVVLFWKNISGGIFNIYEIVPGFIFSFIAIVTFSLTDKKPPDEVMEEFEKASKELTSNSDLWYNSD